MQHIGTVILMFDIIITNGAAVAWSFSCVAWSFNKGSVSAAVCSGAQVLTPKICFREVWSRLWCSSDFIANLLWTWIDPANSIINQIQLWGKIVEMGAKLLSKRITIKVFKE
jgi:hypothetical protein